MQLDATAHPVEPGLRRDGVARQLGMVVAQLQFVADGRLGRGDRIAAGAGGRSGVGHGGPSRDAWLHERRKRRPLEDGHIGGGVEALGAVGGIDGTQHLVGAGDVHDARDDEVDRGTPGQCEGDGVTRAGTDVGGQVATREVLAGLARPGGHGEQAGGVGVAGVHAHEHSHGRLRRRTVLLEAGTVEVDEVEGQHRRDRRVGRDDRGRGVRAGIGREHDLGVDRYVRERSAGHRGTRGHPEQQDGDEQCRGHGRAESGGQCASWPSRHEAHGVLRMGIRRSLR